jgi:hypothetical protein
MPLLLLRHSGTSDGSGALFGGFAGFALGIAIVLLVYALRSLRNST